MTEIKIEKKRQIWSWLLVVLVIVSFIVFFFVLTNDTVDKTGETISEENNIDGNNSKNLLDVKENNRTVAAFVSFIGKDTSMVSIDYAFIKEAFLKLTNATSAMAAEIDYNIQEDLDRVNESVKLIDNEPPQTYLARNIRNATDNSTIAFQHMQLARYPWLTEELDALKNASTAIQPQMLATEQKDAIINYFVKASDLLHKMN